ncbi:MAG TPA: YbaK/EbsC family protein [Paracoccaceae bacterium]|nr:YbaK/EbsC family protein [Paracoccaceae bacterium]
MSIAKQLKDYLDRSGVAYETVGHPRTATASQSAQAAHVPGDCLAKTVVIHHEEGAVLAVIPSTHRVDLTTLQELVGRRLGLASETEIQRLFADCDLGAVPPIGAAYGLPALIDTALAGREAIWFEGGDHRTLVKISGADFDRLMKGARQAAFSHHT